MHKVMQKNSLFEKRLKFYAASLLFLALSFVIDKPFLKFVEGMKNSFFDVFFSWISLASTLVIVFAVITTIVMWQMGHKNSILLMLTIFLFSFVLGYFFKFVFLRERPNPAFTGYSFPSLHATSTFSVLPMIIEKIEKLKTFFIIFAFLIAFSRIYLGAHYLSDVVGGIMMGIVVYDIFSFLDKKYNLGGMLEETK